MYLCAIGSSAGGLDALTKVLKNNLETDVDLAFIIAQHLSPSHDSKLTDLLSRVTNWEVKTAKHKQKIKKGVIYITPPDSDITVTAKTIKISKASSVIGPKPNINLLFESVAKNFKDRAIGMILSGSGTDGASGISAIKNAGGFTITQDPTQAASTGMPNAAIETLHTDLIFDVEQTKEILAQILEQKFSPSEKLTVVNTTDFDKVLLLLEVYSKIDFTYYKENTLRRRIKTRVEHLKLKDTEKYLDYVKDNPEEIKVLLDYVLIGVTQFFRDPESFKALKKELIVRLKSFDREVFRVWVAGCATGEESYSIAMIIHDIKDEFDLDLDYQIFSTDVDEKSLQFARKGVYASSSVNLLSADHLKRYFKKEGNDFVIKKEIRSSVLFSKHDLTGSPPFLNLDLISCRNLLIYLESSIQRKIIPMFHYSLVTHGLIFLGQSETLGSDSNSFHEVDAKHKLWKRDNSKSVRGLHFFRKEVNEKKKLYPKESTLTFSKWIKGGFLYHFHHPFVVIDEKQQMVYSSDNLGEFIRYKGGQVSNNLFTQISEDLEIDVRTIISKSIKTNQYYSLPIKLIKRKGKSIMVKLVVYPLEKVVEDYFILIFEHFDLPKQLIGSSSDLPDQIAGDRYLELERELRDTKEQLRNYIEELETSNEEIQSLNEEFQSANEELQSTNEELETSNEELQSMNEEVEVAYQELKEANKAVTEKERALKQVYDNLKILIDSDIKSHFLLNKKYRVEDFNHVAEKLIMKWSGKKLSVGQSFKEIIPGHLANEFLNFFKHLDENGSFSKEMSVVPNNETGHRLVQVCLNAILSQDLEKVYSISIHDITDLIEKDRIIQSQKIELTKTEKEYKDLFQRASQGFAKFKVMGKGSEKDHILLFANPKFYEILDITKHQDTIKTLQDLNLQLGLNLVSNILEFKNMKDMKESHLSFFEFNLNKWLGLQLFRINKSEIGLFLSDETERQKLEMELESKLEILSKMSEMAQVGGFEYVVASNELFWSDEVFRIHEIPFDQKPTVEKAIRFYTDDSKSKVESAFFNAVEKSIPYDIEVDLRSGKGEIKRVRTFGTPIIENGKVVKILGALMDITDVQDQKHNILRLNEELSRSNKELENFAYVTSHDLQEPIRMVAAFTELLTNQLGDELNEQHATYFKFIREGALRMKQMIDDLLEYSRVNTKEYPLSQINGDNALQNVLKVLNPKIEESGANIKYEKLPLLNFNSTLIERILINLIGNAIKYNDKKEIKIEVGCTSNKDEHMLFVKDNGQGIDKAFHDQVFTIFKRLNTNKPGSGIGLTIVQRILTRFGGRIWIESERGKGSTFWFSIPISK